MKTYVSGMYLKISVNWSRTLKHTFKFVRQDYGLCRTRNSPEPKLVSTSVIYAQY